jgi:uncharacterized membrane protein
MGGELGQAYNRIIIWLFIDGVWLHKYWGCHRISDRCFVVEGRQFHICARCTGLVVGLPISFLLLPLRSFLPVAFLLFSSALILDGVTQLARWRTSNNALRFVTGLGTAATFLPATVALWSRL